MKQLEKWEQAYDEILRFVLLTKHCPSRHRIEEHQMLNWIKYNKRLMRMGRLDPSRSRRFQGLLAAMESFQRVNQYAYKIPSTQQMELDL